MSVAPPAARTASFCWPMPCPALGRELVHPSKRRARIVLHHLVASPNATHLADSAL